MELGWEVESNLIDKRGQHWRLLLWQSTLTWPQSQQKLQLMRLKFASSVTGRDFEYDFSSILTSTYTKSCNQPLSQRVWTEMILSLSKDFPTFDCLKMSQDSQQMWAVSTTKTEVTSLTTEVTTVKTSVGMLTTRVGTLDTMCYRIFHGCELH